MVTIGQLHAGLHKALVIIQILTITHRLIKAASLLYEGSSIETGTRRCRPVTAMESLITSHRSIFLHLDADTSSHGIDGRIAGKHREQGGMTSRRPEIVMIQKGNHLASRSRQSNITSSRGSVPGSAEHSQSALRYIKDRTCTISRCVIHDQNFIVLAKLAADGHHRIQDKAFTIKDRDDHAGLWLVIHTLWTIISNMGGVNPKQFQEAVTRTMDGVESIATIQAETSSGIYGLRMRFADHTLAEAYIRSFLPAKQVQEFLSISVVSSSDIDLSHLVPKPPEQGRTYVDQHHMLTWSAGKLPVLNIFDRTQRRGLVWLANGSAPAWELSRPACPLLNYASLESPWTATHGAAVGRNGQFLLLAGKGHAGKTTAALACAYAGWDYAGDDYIFTNSLTGEVAPLYTSARLREDMAHNFADLLARTARCVSCDFGEIKHELELSCMIDPSRIRGGRIAAILIPRRRGARQMEFQPASRADAFHALFTATSFGAPGPMKKYAEKLSSLVAHAPIFFVDTAQSVAAIPDGFEHFMNGL